MYHIRLLLDSRGVDFTRAYHAIFASRFLLEVIIFQGPYEGFARFRRTVEQKTLESHKSLIIILHPCVHDALQVMLSASEHKI